MALCPPGGDGQGVGQQAVPRYNTGGSQMDVLKELLDNARKLLGEMSSTQRASIVTMVITVASLLVLIVWLGSMGEKRINVPLEVRVSLAESESYKSMLTAGGITFVDYDDKEGLLLVPEAEKRKALVILAQNKAIPADSGMGFEEALKQREFVDTKEVSAERSRIALQNEVARMIQGINGISRAKVIYSDGERKPLFRSPHRQRAAVEVTMELGRSLDQSIADTIISLVTFARAGLDEKDVVVTDQKGSHFRKDDETSIGRMAVKEFELNRIVSDRARREIEECVRRTIPDSEVYAWVDTKWDMTRKTTFELEILQGLPTQVITRKIKDNSSDKPSNVVGTQPNIRRSTNMETAGGREVVRNYERGDKDTRFDNGKRETHKTFAPEIKSQTISVVVHLPPRPVFDKDGNRVMERDTDGKPVINPNTGQPLGKLQSSPELKGEELTQLERSIRKVAGMLEGAQNMEVEITQVPWTPELEPDKRTEQVDRLREFLNANVVSLVMMGILLMAIYLVYLQAKRSIPAEEVELPESADFGGMFSPAHMTDEDRAQQDFEQMRDQVGEFIDEDPAKAASIVRRWMTTREGY